MSHRGGGQRHSGGPVQFPPANGSPSSGGGRGYDGPSYEPEPEGYRDSPPDAVGAYRGGGGRGSGGVPSGVQGGMHINFNVEQMVSMVFEMRGSLAHEVEARRSLEQQLYEARGAIEALKDNTSREGNKWSNLIARVKELEVGSKMDMRMMDLQGRAERVTRNQEQGKIVHVFNDVRSRLDAQEREYRDQISRLAHEHSRDQSRLDGELRQLMSLNLTQVEARAQGVLEQMGRIGAKVGELERDFAVFLNTQMQLQLNLQNKEKDGDWLKIYLTEQFNAQKSATDLRFQEVQQAQERLAEQQRILDEKIQHELQGKIREVHEHLRDETANRDAAIRKVQKVLKTSFTSLGDTMSSGLAGLDQKVDAKTRTQNEALSNLHAMVLGEQKKFLAHQAAFEGAMAKQREFSVAQHSLAARIDGLEEVLKAEIKARLKNYQKVKLQEMNMQAQLDARLQSIQAGNLARDEATQRNQVETEAHFVLQSLVAQVEEASYTELRKSEWTAFGRVIELELQTRDEELRALIGSGSGAGAGGADGGTASSTHRSAAAAAAAASESSIRAEMSALRESIRHEFAQFEAHERVSKREEEEQAALMSLAMETRSVLDGMVACVADQVEQGVLNELRGRVDRLGEQVEQQVTHLQDLTQVQLEQHQALEEAKMGITARPPATAAAASSARTATTAAASTLPPSGAPPDNLTLVNQRLDSFERLHLDLSESLHARVHKVDQSVLGMQSLADEALLASEKRLRELAERVEQGREESEEAQRAMDRKLRAYVDEVEQLKQQMALRGGAPVAAEAEGAAGGDGGGGGGDVSAKLHAHSLLLSRLDADLRSLSVSSAEAEAKHTKRARELSQALGDQLEHGQALAVQLKSMAASSDAEQANRLAQMEQRMHDELQRVQHSLSQQDVAFQKHAHEVGARIQAVEAALQEAMGGDAVGRGGGGYGHAHGTGAATATGTRQPSRSQSSRAQA